MPKIPKNLTDKDMVKNYVEEETIESKLIAAEKKAELIRRAEKLQEPPEPLAKAGFTPELSDRLGKELLALKIELANAGVKNYNFKIKRDGDRITLTVTDKKF